MKKGLIYVAGVVTGIVLTILFGVFLSKTYDNEGLRRGITMFDETGDCISENEFKVFQVLEPGVALAREKSSEYLDVFLGVVVLFVNDEGKHDYDDEIITVSRGKCVRQVGVYKYSTKDGYKTVPVVEKMDKMK